MGYKNYGHWSDNGKPKPIYPCDGNKAVYADKLHGDTLGNTYRHKPGSYNIWCARCARIYNDTDSTDILLANKKGIEKQLFSIP